MMNFAGQVQEGQDFIWHAARKHDR